MADDVGTLDSGLNSAVLASNNELVILPINEPTFGTKRKSQIQTYLEQNEGPGLQHLALKARREDCMLRCRRACCVHRCPYDCEAKERMRTDSERRKKKKKSQATLPDSRAGHTTATDTDKET